MNSRVVLQCVVVAMVMTAMFEEATSLTICKVEASDLLKCKDAVTGDSPPEPTQECCGVIKQADLSCLCGYKSFLPALGIDPAKALALGPKCGITDVPPSCRG